MTSLAGSGARGWRGERWASNRAVSFAGFHGRLLTGNVLLLEKGGEAINVDDKLILDRKCELCVSPAALDTGRAQVLFKESKIKCSVQVA